VVPGTRGKTTAARAVIDAVEQHFRAAGLSVRHDDPYRGGATTARWGRPHEGFHAVQVELNRALYMDEDDGDPRPERFDWLADVCAGLVDRLAALVDAGALRT
jgi:N-formylglutamate amidohydrolase